MNFTVAKNFFKRLRLLFLFLAIIIAIFVIFIPKINQRQSLDKQNKELLKKIEKINFEIESYRQREYNIQNNPNHLEKLARNKLGYTGSDEVIYKFK